MTIRNKSLFTALAAIAGFAIVLMAGCENTGPTNIGDSHQVTVDDRGSFAQIVGRSHLNKDQVSDDINPERFKIPFGDVHDETMKLISFNREISSDNAEREMAVRKLRPAKFDECLAYDAELTRVREEYDLSWPRYRIICLGQSARTGSFGGDLKVPVLYPDFGEWSLGLSAWRGNWDWNDRFLAVEN